MPHTAEHRALYRQTFKYRMMNREWSRQQRRKAGQRPVVTRICLRCDRKFRTWKGFRLCGNCRDSVNQDLDYCPERQKYHGWAPR